MSIQLLPRTLCEKYNDSENGKKRISVIVPVYRVENYLIRCLDSLCLQDFDGVEFILIDDGSPDRCGEICDRYAIRDKRFKVFHKENGGLSSARNYGIEHAEGDYIMFVDSDDWVSSDFCSRAYELAVSNDADLVMFMFQMVEDDRCLPLRGKHLKSGIKTNKEALDLLFEEPGVFAWNKLYKKTLFDGVRYPVGRVYEDQAVTWKLVYKANRVYFANQVLYFYYMRPTSIMHQETVQTARDKFEMKFLFYNELKETGYTSEKFQSLLLGSAMAYAMRIKENSDDETGVLVHEILRNNHTIPKSFLWRQKIMLFLYKRNVHLFDMACTLGRKRIS